EEDTDVIEDDVSESSELHLHSDDAASSRSSRTDERIPSMLLMLYMLPASLLMLTLGFFPLEYAKLKESTFLSEKLAETLAYLCLGALLAFWLNMSEMMVVAATNGLTLCVTGVARLVVIVLISGQVFGHEIHALNGIGMSISLSGALAYQLLRHREKLQRQRAVASSNNEVSAELDDLLTDVEHQKLGAFTTAEDDENIDANIADFSIGGDDNLDPELIPIGEDEQLEDEQLP
ncbi:MAG: hypothetical protein MHM6MM_007958, partial [Cercozoa sp. M6MM]